MRCRISFKANTAFTLVWNYQYCFNMSMIKFMQYMYFKDLISKEVDIYFKQITQSKLYCYSKLMHNNHSNITVNKDGINNVQSCYFIFTTPFEFEDKNLLKEHFLNKKIFFTLDNQIVELLIVRIDFLEEQQITNHFSCISPIVVNEKDYFESTNCVEYHPQYSNELFNSQIKKDLLEKYQQLNNVEYDSDFDFDFSFDNDYLVRKKNKISKLITFESRKFKAYEAPFTISAPEEIIKTAYICGIGNNNHIGFGCIEAVK
ncbi:MAG: CRISPR-associated endoribonuclease Cas6 [Candidatus Cloacimonetes bacterium]|jgi:CRISPR-associated endoribonuclease Cas6|nr:CRISPR-associated endoribonuclease Cas6 [Candidatus Cloacimonadota bacterium]